MQYLYKDILTILSDVVLRKKGNKDDFYFSNEKEVLKVTNQQQKVILSRKGRFERNYKVYMMVYKSEK